MFKKSKIIKDKPLFSRKQIIMAGLPWAIIATLALSGVSFIAGWHSHQLHDQYIESRIDSAVSELKASE